MRNGASWGKKEKASTDEEKEDHGDQWDHVAMDAESKAVISMTCCKQTKENTEFVERQNGTDRHLNARKARKTLAFSGDQAYLVSRGTGCLSNDSRPLGNLVEANK